MKPIPIGTKGSVTVTVEEGSLASSTGSGGVDVFSTPCLVLLMEEAAVEALQGYLDERETTVGTHICIDHIAATPLGLQITADAEVTQIDGRKLTFAVTAHDDLELIGKGVHERFLVDREKFTSKSLRKIDIHKDSHI
ncbi:MAG: thioesterase family protein [Firmicutes bacterium]|jgi:predicted thioesterase|nr:thioesterase family protein [Candidatus Fermentithermobacillaceae bacterium]